MSVFSIEEVDRRSNDPQRGVGLDQTPLRVATTSRLGTNAMLVRVTDAVQTNFGAKVSRCLA